MVRTRSGNPVLNLQDMDEVEAEIKKKKNKGNVSKKKKNEEEQKDESQGNEHGQNGAEVKNPSNPEAVPTDQNAKHIVYAALTDGTQVPMEVPKIDFDAFTKFQKAN
uniref:Uncharacterized protein n=1 Tax=Chromera velia CCMP2878 TaxID=1169474 RepID=A0A0G4FD75_9ALVE|eukprot:Cvel_3188.t1-p1 / transcript=Cvel_3188.t1 / gene=Cvel_3188 / organism=Chromera_velia_CCMP2878 / gene_product=hypothetical protein / transcript_product=hypothetical protein / location=Cvel_scaffold124:67342-67659(+) / protein_length=106 / sequence_SO=supercontig / SO=protein_coding / is_pseudo=false